MKLKDIISEYQNNYFTNNENVYYNISYVSIQKTYNNEYKKVEQIMIEKQLKEEEYEKKRGEK